MKKLKEIDKKLLNLIQEEEMAVPRITKIAKKIGLPVTTVKTKLDKFKELGIIKGYSAIINPEKVDRSFLAFALGNLKMGKTFEFEKAGKEISKIPEVQTVSAIIGEWDYLVKYYVKDQNEYYNVIQKIAKNFTMRAKGIVASKIFKDSHKILIK